MINRKQAILIFESVDKAGKSFLAQLLNEALDIPLYKGVTSPQSKEELKKLDRRETVRVDLETLYEFLRQTKYSILIDRLYLSELVYSKVYNRHVDEEFIWEMDSKFADLGAVIVYVSVPLKVLKLRWGEEKLIEFEEAIPIIKQYEAALKKTRCKVVHYSPLG